METISCLWADVPCARVVVHDIQVARPEAYDILLDKAALRVFVEYSQARLEAEFIDGPLLELVGEDHGSGSSLLGGPNCSSIP